MPLALNVSAVRPYSRRIRSQVFRALEDLGARVTTLVEPGTPDDASIAAVRSTRCDALLIPFHAHRDTRGTLVHGLGLIERIRAEVPSHQSTKIICPISNVGLAAAGLMSARIEGPLLDGVLLLDEDSLEAHDVAAQMRRFLSS